MNDLLDLVAAYSPAAAAVALWARIAVGLLGPWMRPRRESEIVLMPVRLYPRPHARRVRTKGRRHR